MTVATEQGTSVENRETRIAAAAGGDKAAFAELYQEFAPKVYNLVLRSVRNAPAAEDVCQEVWVRAYQKLPELREPAAFSTWLYRIASRACIDRARKPAGSQAGEEELPEQLAASPHDNPEDATIRHERERLLWQALGALPARQHLALFLREVEDRNYQEIAGILGTTESAIETLLFRARRGVAEAFERLQVAGERCGQAKKTMAVLIDGEATPVQRRAVQAHVNECTGCRLELAQQRQGSAAYGVLPLLPLPALLAERVLQSIGTATIGTGGGMVGKILALFATKVKLATAALTLTGGIAVATMAVPGDSLHLDAATVSRQRGAVTADESASAGLTGIATIGTATPSGLSGGTPTIADLAALASALGALEKLSQQMVTVWPPLSLFSATPAAALDQLSHLLTPPVVVPAVTPPFTLPTVTLPIALPTAILPITLPTATLPIALPTATLPIALPTVTPPIAPPTVTPPIAPPTVTPTIALPTVTPPIALPTVTPPIPLP
jgi:RNA polymerase sigma-70 factor (ECF subfamily)